jgi:hypothetical protein
MNTEKFKTTLEKHLTVLFKTPAYAMAASKTTPPAMAERVTAGLIDGSASKDGEGVQLTLKELGIKNTYTAIKSFLQS